MGSVKDLEVLEGPTEDRMGRGRFHFSDRYSVFDWGEMPQHIPGKGAALCLMGAYFLEKLEDSHYVGLVENGRLVSLDELDGPTSTMEVRLVRVIREPSGERGNYLIPLEWIYRNVLPAGSSVFRRIESGELSLGFDPEPWQVLKEPLYEVSTKLEERDRYLSWEEAQRLAGMSDEEMELAREKVGCLNGLITRELGGTGVMNADGKVELAFTPERELMVVDVLGTPDECRFLWGRTQLSKEFLRQLYRRTDWYREVLEAKKRKSWKSYCSQPPRLDERYIRLASNLYKSLANTITRRGFFDAPPLQEVVKEIDSILLAQEVEKYEGQGKAHSGGK